MKQTHEKSVLASREGISQFEAMAAVAAVQGEHQRMLTANLLTVASRPDVSTADLLALLQPVQMRLTGPSPGVRPPLRTSPRGGEEPRITSLSSSPEVVRAPAAATVEDDEEDAEEANE